MSAVVFNGLVALFCCLMAGWFAFIIDDPIQRGGWSFVEALLATYWAGKAARRWASLRKPVTP